MVVNESVFLGQSQGDESAGMSHKDTTDTTVNRKRHRASCTRPRDCARETAHKSALASGHETTGSTGACLKHSNFLKVNKRTVSLTTDYMKSFPGRVRNFTDFLGSTCLDELSIASDLR